MSFCRSRSVLLRIYNVAISQQYRAASLYGNSSLGLDRYIDIRSKVLGQFSNLTDKYREKMKQFVEEDNKNIIFTEDLKNMVHISTKEDLDLISSMVKKYNKQNAQLRFGNFVFGPVVMRMYHHLDAPDAALELFRDPGAENFFDQMSSMQTLMDLLYKHDRFDDIRNVFEYVREKKINMLKYPKNVVVITIASCYRENTKESLDYATQIWTDMIASGNEPLRKTVALFGGLALNHNAPHITLEVLSRLKEQNYISVRNLKAAALADLNRADEALSVMRASLNLDFPNAKGVSFFKDVLEKIENSVNRSTNKDVKREFEQLMAAFTERQLIKNEPIGVLLCQQINLIPKEVLDTTKNVPGFARKYIKNPTRVGLEGLY